MKQMTDCLTAIRSINKRNVQSLSQNVGVSFHKILNKIDKIFSHFVVAQRHYDGTYRTVEYLSGTRRKKSPKVVRCISQAIRGVKFTNQKEAPHIGRIYI